MSTFIFDLNGALENNKGGLPEEACKEILSRLKEEGHEVIIWSGLIDDQAEMWLPHCTRMIEKTSQQARELDMKGVILVDDDEVLLSLCSRRGARVLHAYNLKIWHGFLRLGKSVDYWRAYTTRPQAAQRRSP